jgi:hypothetical protein
MKKIPSAMMIARTDSMKIPAATLPPTALPAHKAVRRAAHDYRHAHRTPSVQQVLVRLAPPARVGSAGSGSGPAARVGTAGQTSTAIPSIGHGTHQVLSRPIGFHAQHGCRP